MGTDFLKKAALTAVVLLSFCTGAKGYLHQGVNYVLRSDKTAAVTKLSQGLYEGDLFIWDRFTVEDVTYRVTEIGYYAFKNCTSLATVSYTLGLKEITIPDKVTIIGMNTFSNCTGLETVNIGNGEKTVDLYAFEHCTNITTIRLGKAVEKIENGNFRPCPNLQTVYCLAATPPNVRYLDDGTINYLFNAANVANATLYVPSASLSQFQQTTVWNNFENIVPISYPTAVAGVENTADDGQWYDLTGRKVERPAKGV